VKVKIQFNNPSIQLLKLIIMKKSIFFMSLVLGLFMSVFALTACGSDDDDNGSPEGLVGTVWRYTNSDNYLFEVNVKSSTVAHILVKSLSTGKIDEDADYTYTYDEVTHTGTATYLSGKSYYGSGSTATFSINGNKMTYAYDGRNITLTKQ
jgi:hypothetical protein